MSGGSSEETSTAFGLEINVYNGDTKVTGFSTKGNRLTVDKSVHFHIKKDNIISFGFGLICRRQFFTALICVTVNFYISCPVDFIKAVFNGVYVLWIVIAYSYFHKRQNSFPKFISESKCHR